MSNELQILSILKDHVAYKHLEDLWRARLSEIQEKRDKAAQRGSETAWRYWAGVEKGFQEAVTLLPLTILHMEDELDSGDSEKRLDSIVSQLQGEPK